MKFLQTSLIALVVIFVILLVTQLWFEVFPEGVFFKLTVTFGIIFGTVVVILLIKRHLFEEDKLKKDKFID